jgi:ABC-2 type transport system ATP-binding protein
MTAVDVRGVTKRYGDVVALRDLDLTVESGEVYGFLGPNGAGKSTTIDVLLDYTRPTSGTARVLGRDTQAESVSIGEDVGVLPDGFGVLGTMTGRQHLRFAARAKGVDEDLDALAERVGIDHALDRQATGYSKGMAQRLMLGVALVGAPDLLILDEPSTGLDPNGARRMREIVREENDRGATVFFSSHIMEQVEAVCDRVGILRAGELVAEDSIEGLRETLGTRAAFSVTLDDQAAVERAVERVRDLDGVSDVRVTGSTITADCDQRAKAAVVDAAREGGATVVDIRSAETSLEELFANVTEGEGTATTPSRTASTAGEPAASVAAPGDAGGDGGESP